MLPWDKINFRVKTMATIKVRFRPSKVKKSPGSIYFQVTHLDKSRCITSSYKVFAEEWNSRFGIITPDPLPSREEYLRSVHESIRLDIGILSDITHILENNNINFTADDIVSEFLSYKQKYTLFRYIDGIIVRLRKGGKVRTSETYTSALRSFRKFRNGADILLYSITSDLMESYEDWLKSRGLTKNTIGFYTRILRAVYNRAVNDHIIRDRKPFRRVYTGVDKTEKRALPVSLLKKIASMNLTGLPALDYARDMFVLSFCLRGMSFIDMAYLKKSDLCGDTIVYRRHKTGQLLTIRWTPEMQMLLDKYPENPTGYLLPIITDAKINPRYAYRKKSYHINRNLKKIMEMIGVKFPLTLYVARHSWASTAKIKGIPVSVISQGMGHDSEATTRIYLASLENSVVDNANSLIIDTLFS